MKILNHDYIASENEILRRAESGDSELAACFTSEMTRKERRTALYKLRDKARNQISFEPTRTHTPSQNFWSA